MFVSRITLGLLVVSFLSMAVGAVASLHPILIVATFLAPGCALLSTVALWNWLKRRSALFALTKVRAIVAQQSPFKRLLSYPICRDQPLMIGATSPKSIYFANSRRHLKYVSYRVFHGFDHLADFDTALEHATSVQCAASWRPKSFVDKTFKWFSKSNRTNAA